MTLRCALAAPRRALAALALLVVALFANGPAAAQPETGTGAEDVESTAPEDYDTESREWNGLHTLTAVARGLGLRVQATNEVDWADLGADDILFVIYPETRVDAGHMASFIRNGGHVLIADDFGDSVDLLGRLGMLRAQGGGVAAQRFYRELDYAPIALPVAPSHLLAQDVDELVTNVPGVLTQTRGAEVIFAFGPDAAVVATGTMGRGRFVVVSDASIFINRMLQFEGNLQLAINAIRFLSREDHAVRMVLLTRDFSLSGEPVALFPSGSVDDRVAGATLDVNRLLDEGNDYLLTEWALRVVGVVMALVVAFLVVWSLPSLRRDDLEGSWTRTAAPTASEHFDAIVERYQNPERDANFALPAAVLRDTLNRDLSRALRHGDPLGSIQESQLVQAVRDLGGAEAGDAMARIYSRLRSLPPRHQAASLARAGYLSQRDFEHLLADVAKLQLALGEAQGHS
ncbi:MAG TPA: DUF4350 domain-containing protein [Haliangium sp.]|nr:DUF4350 domain-containing protein [Haliangium sp.]